MNEVVIECSASLIEYKIKNIKIFIVINNIKKN